MFGSMKLVQVEPGTVIEHQGEKLTVDDNSPVAQGATLYVTEKTFEAIRARCVKGNQG